MRERSAAVIERDGRLLMVRHRSRGPTGRHDGDTYLTLPGGGVEDGESPEAAAVREVAEEVGLRVTAATRLAWIEHGAGATTVFRVEVDPGDPVLGTDPELACDCPRLVGLTWVDAPAAAVWDGPHARAWLKLSDEGDRH
ncbi:NUDIX domain-containing protein [Nocardioides flavescens]|uniref:NUDIX domain-containing protein n=1 Tax=Nocardioides flavescens TaxID=2691959 RepID=UPI00301D9AC5